ncbi:unnamed protein product [Vitrella brassicaformis CCMP3155]|uniref:Uncharacterized protein n=1 Tax=Vitrella brassicaformis (strain CCMP3155) TaxID=1169540 RepID=A0A0G4EFD0_VITBC|nr:unnamed protein product [Vitrella brassicaformis CCMP3155]|eukprot:CEL94686.1 unnamed protein product [Vitrella brassicaformis CCMP3155]
MAAQEHPVSHLFVGSRGHQPDIVTTARLRATSRRIRAAFTIAELRTRLVNSLSRDGDGINTQQPQLAYGSLARVLAQLKMVGRHVHFSDGTCLQLFHHGNGEVRAIVDEPGFELGVDPPLPADHLDQQHRQQHDPPVRNRICYSATGRWREMRFTYTDASLSSFARDKIIHHFRRTHQTNGTCIGLNRRVGGGRLDGLLTQSPHTPVAGCSTTFSYDADGIGDVRELVLTDDSHNFVAWIILLDPGDGTGARQAALMVT